MNLSWTELRRRKVVRVLVAYVIGAWLLLQIGDTLFGLLELPGWTGKVLVAALALGFPLVLVLSWVFDITPHGLKKTGSVDERASDAFRYGDPEPINAGELDLLRPQATPLIGRDKEMALLNSRLEEAAEGRGGMVLIGGEPGAGKTRPGTPTRNTVHRSSPAPRSLSSWCAPYQLATCVTSWARPQGRSPWCFLICVGGSRTFHRPRKCHRSSSSATCSTRCWN